MSLTSNRLDWTRNEWLFVDGEWRQTSFAIRNGRTSTADINDLKVRWKTHQWIHTSNLIIGVPVDGTNNYLVVFSRP